MRIECRLKAVAVKLSVTDAPHGDIGIHRTPYRIEEILRTLGFHALRSIPGSAYESTVDESCHLTLLRDDADNTLKVASGKGEQLSADTVEAVSKQLLETASVYV